MESSGGPPDQPGGGPPPPPPAGSGGPPPPPPPPPGGGPPGGGPPGGGWGQPEQAQPGGYQPPPAYQPPAGYGQPGYAQPGYAQPGYAQPGYPGTGMAGYAFAGPQVLQGRELAGYGARVGAYLIDFLIGILLLLTIVGWIFIPSLVMARKGKNNGQTWGKQACGIRVIRSDGKEYSFGDAFVREFVVKALLFGFVGGFFFLPPLIDLLWPLWDERNQTLHDKMVDSYVVKA